MSKKKEIGSEFWEIPIINEEGVFPKSVQWFLSGRSALKAILEDIKGCNTVAMPSWCCDSMIKPFIDRGIKIKFYPVYYQNGLVREVNMDCDILFILDYFGYTFPSMPSYAGVVIRDVTQSVFSDIHYDADYYFGSLRKWCGVWTGGYAWTRDGHVLSVSEFDDRGYTILREKAMKLKDLYINDLNYSENTLADKRYLTIFEAAERKLEEVGIVPAAERDIWMAQRLNVEFIKTKRKVNANILHSEFKDWTIFKNFKETDCPMFVPILVPDGHRNELREYLIRNDIYCPVHWPVSAYHELNEEEKFIYDNELSLVCDQRYSEEDMYRMVDIIGKYWKGV